MNVTLTRFTNTKGILTKRAWVEDGELKREGATQLAKGEFTVVSQPWAEFDKFLLSLTHDQAIALGVPKSTSTQGLVTSKKAGGPGITRTLDNFKWPDTNKVALLDFDAVPDDSSMEAELARLIDVCPELEKLSFWLYPSSSSYLSYQGGTTSLRGFHAYTLLSACTSVDNFRAYLQVRLKQAGLESYIISKGVWPRILLRYPVDFSVFSPERLVYSAGSHCDRGVSQDRGKPVFVPGASSDKPNFIVSPAETRAAEELSKVAKARFARENNLEKYKREARELRAKTTSATGAKTQERYFERSEVPASLEILIDDGRWVKAWRFLVEPEVWDKTTCHDPFEPDYDNSAPNKAIVFAEVGAIPAKCTIVSHAHGTHAYRVVLDKESILEVLDKMSKNTIEDVLGESWEAKLFTQDSISEGERNDLLQPIQAKAGLTSIKEAKDRIAAGVSVAQKDKINKALGEYNEVFATVEVGGGSFRVLRKVVDDRGDTKVIMQKKADFIDALAGDTLPVWSGNKCKKVSKAKLWLDWQNRRHYSQTIFDPSTPDEEVELPGGKIAFNLFQGFRVAPDTSIRVCGEGKKCFSCFFDHLDYKICPRHKKNGGVTYWLRHIHEVVCHRDKFHTRWVVDWLCDIIKHPAGPRPGTALVVYGEDKGTGKGAVIWPLIRILGSAAMHTSNTEHIVGRFNSQLEQIVLCFADEATWSRGKAAASALKYIVTEPRFNVERKGIEIYSVKNFVRLYVSSNNEHAIPAEIGERRYAVFEILRHKKGKKQAWFDKFLSAKFLPVFLDEVLSLPCLSDLSTIPQTTALLDQKQVAMENRIELAFIDWLFDNYRAAWNGDLTGRNVSNKDFEELVSASGVLAGAPKGLSPPAAVRKIRRFCKKIFPTEAWKTAKARGFIFPPFRLCLIRWEEYYGYPKGDLLAKYLGEDLGEDPGVGA